MNYNETINLLENKIDEVTRKGDISPSEMDCIYKATKSIYYLTTTEAMKTLTMVINLSGLTRCLAGVCPIGML